MIDTACETNETNETNESAAAELDWINFLQVVLKHLQSVFMSSKTSNL